MQKIKILIYFVKHLQNMDSLMLSNFEVFYSVFQFSEGQFLSRFQILYRLL